MKVVQGIIQGTAEWHAQRRERVTGTDLASVMGTPWDRLQLIAELIAESGTEQTKAFRTTPEMERGSAEEIFAVRAYQDQTKQKVARVGFCVSEEFEWFGVSPDGLIKEKKKGGKYTGGIEVKSPDSKTLVMYKIANLVPDVVLSAARKPFLGVPADYKWQVVAQFLANEDLEWLDFLVWDPRFIEESQKLYIVRVGRDNTELQKALEEAKAALISFRVEWLRCKDIVLPTGF